MNPQRRHVLRHSLIVAAAPLALAARRARTCEFAGGTLVVQHPWTRGTPAAAPHAVVCMTFADVLQDDRLVALAVPIADGAHWQVDGRSLALDALPLKAGRDMVLREDGTHLRLTGLREPLVTGRVLPMQMTFERGGLVRAELHVDF